MLGDEAQPAEDDGQGGATSGPRHAAPRKSLLTKLHMPAGKAVALAAMPTAVLMGMGFTPHLAQADELPKSPFKPGPCVTQSDTPTPSATGGARSGGTGGTADKPKPDPTTSPSVPPKPPAGLAAPKPSTTPSPAATGKPATESLPENEPGATPSPSATKGDNPLDPLGLGGLLGGLLGVGGGSDSSAPGTTPAGQASAPDPTTTAAPPADPVRSTVETAGKTVKDTADAAKDTAHNTVKGATDGVRKTARSVKDAATTPPASSGGKQAFPCPTADPQALADAKTEQGIPLLADTPWILKSSMLTLYGLEYHGIVKVKRHNGTVVKVLKFTATGVDIADLQQIVDGPDGTKTHVSARRGSTSTIRNGTVTMYTESISGSLFGAAPITFTPKFPPPVTIPLFFTNVTVVQAAQFGGDLTVPGMKVVPGK